MTIGTFTVTCDLSTYALAERGGGYGKLVVMATPGYMPVPADLTSLVQPDPVTIDTDGTASITLAAIPGVKYTVSTSPRNLFTPFTFDALGAGVTSDLSELMPVPATSPTTPYLVGPAGSTTWAGITDKPGAFTPSAHKGSHATGGSDPLTPADIGAATTTQGAKADSAVQPAALPSSIATSIQDPASAAGSYLNSTFARSSALVRPVTRRREATTMRLSAGAGTFAGAGASSAVGDTSDYALGTSAAKLVTNGAAGYAAYTFPSLGPWDMSTASALRLVIKIDSYTNLNFLTIDVGTTSGFVNRFTCAVGEPGIRTTLRVAREGEWLVLDLPRAGFTTGAGAPDWSNVTTIRVAATDTGGGAITARINGVGPVPSSPLLPSGAVIFTFDDSSTSHWSIAKAKLDSVGSPGVAYPIADQIGAGGLTMAQLKTMRDISGWEVGTHALTTADHAQGFAGLTEAQVVAKFDALKSWAATNGLTSDTHAWPNGDSDATAETVASRYVSSARGTTAGVQSSAVPNALRLRCTDLGSGTSLATAQSRIDGAKSNRNISIFMCHQIVASGATGLQVLQATFEGAVDYAVAQGVPILTMTAALKQLQLV